MNREKLFQDKKTMPQINQAVTKKFEQEHDKSLEDTHEHEESHVNKKQKRE